MLCAAAKPQQYVVALEVHAAQEHVCSSFLMVHTADVHGGMTNAASLMRR